MTIATDYRHNRDFSGNKTCSINFFTSRKLFVRLNYGFWSFAIGARSNSFVKIFASDAADAQTNTFVIENWTTLGQQPFRLKKAHQRSNEKRKKAGFEPGSHDFFFLRRFAISSSATGSKFVVVVTRKLTSHACQAGRPWKRCTRWTSCDSFDRQLMPTNASDVWFGFKRGCFLFRKRWTK